jgi:hypothetical protein
MADFSFQNACFLHGFQSISAAYQVCSIRQNANAILLAILIVPFTKNAEFMSFWLTEV